MDLYLFQHDKWTQLYNNCSGIDTITPIPWAQRQFVPESLVLVTLCTIYYMLYVPCLYSFWRNLRDDNGQPNPCYQIMFYISVVDMSVLWIIGWVHAGVFLTGSVYCTHPHLFYFIGLIALAGVLAETIADGILALNRCVDILSPSLASKMFKGRRLFLWLGTATAYGLYYPIRARPIVFSGRVFAMLFHPYKGFWEDGAQMFPSEPQLSFNELFLCFSTPIIYVLFLIGLSVKIRSSYRTLNISKVQRNAFSQVFMISLFNVVGGSIYFTMEHFPSLVTPQLVVIGHFGWFHIHGIPPVIYVLFNKTVRADIRLLFMKLFRANRVAHIHGITVIKAANKSDNLDETIATKNMASTQMANSQF